VLHSLHGQSIAPLVALACSVCAGGVVRFMCV
jgi:hypothetical protein